MHFTLTHPYCKIWSIISHFLFLFFKFWDEICDIIQIYWFNLYREGYSDAYSSTGTLNRILQENTTADDNAIDFSDDEDFEEEPNNNTGIGKISN